MVVGIGIAYKLFGGLPGCRPFLWSRCSCYWNHRPELLQTDDKISQSGQLNAIQNHWLLWVIYLAGLIVTVITQSEEILLFILAGLVYMVTLKDRRNG
jgi:chromate transporter